MSWLIENEHLTRFRYLAAPPGQSITTAGIKVVRGDYDAKELQASVDELKLAADAVDLYRKHCSPGVRTIAACLNLEHAELVKSLEATPIHWPEPETETVIEPELAPFSTANSSRS